MSVPVNVHSYHTAITARRYSMQCMLKIPHMADIAIDATIQAMLKRRGRPACTGFRTALLCGCDFLRLSFAPSSLVLQDLCLANYCSAEL
jgi:hypothetical protein